MAWKLWNESPNCRTRGGIERQRGRLSGKPQFSTKELPIASLPIQREDPLIHAVPPDILHLRSRVGEKVTGNFLGASAKHTNNKLAPEFQALIRSAGVPFRISETLVHGKSKVVFSSMTGVHWRRLLPKLPDLIRSSTDVFDAAHKEPFAKLIEGFVQILAIAGKGNKTDADRLACLTNSWVTDFLDLGKKGLKGFGECDVTPYIHWMHIHVPYSLSLFGGLDKLSGELLESQNDEIKRTHQRRTHYKDPRQTLMVEKRRELQEMKKAVGALNKPPRKRKPGPLHPW